MFYVPSSMAGRQVCFLLSLQYAKERRACTQIIATQVKCKYCKAEVRGLNLVHPAIERAI